MNEIKKMRTIEQAYNDLKKIDPGTAITKTVSYTHLTLPTN